MLDNSISVSLDHPMQALKLWDVLYINFTNFNMIKFFFKIKDYCLIGGLAKSYITSYLAFIYEVATTFIECAHEAKEATHDFPLKKSLIKKILEELD